MLLSSLSNSCAVIMILFFCTTVNGQSNSKEFSISGEIVGIPNGVPFYLIRKMNGDTVTTTISENGRFNIVGELEYNGEMHFLKFDSAGLGLNEQKQTWIRLYFDDQPIYIYGTVSGWPKVSIKGSPSILMFDSIYNEIEGIQTEVRGMYKNYDSIAEREVLQRIVTALIKYPDELAVADIGLAIRGFDYRDLNLLLQALSDRVKSSYAGDKLSKKAKQLKPENNLRPGNTIPNFSYTDRLGNIKYIRDEIKASKYTLIDFWASWCKPCIEEVPTLAAIYDKYDRRDFQIIGISIDKRESDWINAIKKVGFKWIQRRDSEESVTSDIFGISSIPAYLLLNSAGEMIGFYNGVGKYKSFGPELKGENIDVILASLLSN